MSDPERWAKTKTGAIAFTAITLMSALHGESESKKPILASSTISDPPGYRIAKVDGKEMARINDRFTIVLFSVGQDARTAEIELIKKSPKGDEVGVFLFRADIKPDRNYRIIQDGYTFSVQGEPRAQPTPEGNRARKKFSGAPDNT